MSKRVSHSLLDPWIGPPIKAIYPRLGIPTWFPPEGIVLLGHLSAIFGSIGFALSTKYWWGGIMFAIGVAGNHFADCIDGTHARSTGQCRNGGELLDHFTDPLSFAYWIVGWSIAASDWQYGMAGLIVMYATAVLTNIKAKMLGEFTLATFGPTEFKTGLVGLGMSLAMMHFLQPSYVENTVWVSLRISVIVGAGQLGKGLVSAVREVNQNGAPPDTSEWETVRENKSDL